MIEVPTHISAEKPKGSPFYISSTDFVYGQHQELVDVDFKEGVITNWPLVYILANETTAYVGQTTSAANRMNQHGANEERKDFTTINLIYNAEFNSSVITDYEHRLIGLMHADGKYRLTNKNDGMTDTNYFCKSQYAEMFKDLWEELRKVELAQHTIDEIEESEVFKYSPFKGLTPDQRVAIDEIQMAIEAGLENARPVVVEGMPGTGKTILAIYLLKQLKDNPDYKGMNIRLLEPVTSLRNTLRSALKTVSGLSEDDVVGPLDLVKSKYGYSSNGEKSFDIVLVDEAHRLKRRVNLGTQYGNFDKTSQILGLPKETNQVEWLLNVTKLPIFFYDPLQTVGPSCVLENDIRAALGPAMKNPIRLDTQMRVKGGKAYLDYIADILMNHNPTPTRFEGYELVFHDTIESFYSSFESTYHEHELSRMVAGYAWKWLSKNDANAYDIEIDEVRLRWNRTYDNWVGIGMTDDSAAHEVGCIHSIQGYDLSYTYVLIGDDLYYDSQSKEIGANKNSYYDRNGKNTASDSELDQYIKNIYYVLLTRGIYGTHIYVKNPVLRNRLRKYFQFEA
ncbi:DUF2075 domain-containing protein [Olsenella sp. An293]|uniref:DUF2075 domain-containing protein n=1 Tax=Olsenella sp. An293 TaxID=1965626 RepID=UPI000B3884A2|nr:DUF2075 domain-containing protein [Olsenella sp. An293]OUO31785.1 hypothetical protein B5F85_09345 [Olsenella sp. An293]